MTITTKAFRSAMALFPGAVTLITAGADGNRRGLTATAVCSVSDSPPSLLICINRQSETCALIDRLRQFSVQLLDDGSDEIAMAFAGARGLRAAAKFNVGTWAHTAADQPRLREALACLCCRVSFSADSGSHRIFLGEIAETFTASGEALVYARARFRRLAAA